MQIDIKKTGETLLRAIRRVGYSSSYDRQSFVRVLSSGGYPRFHLYVDEMDSAWIFKLHLDQKRPSYGNGHAHAGEYSGEVVEQEAARISGILTAK